MRHIHPLQPIILIILATLAFFIANRLLPEGPVLAGLARAKLETLSRTAQILRRG